jgi:hypothetical protein
VPRRNRAAGYARQAPQLFQQTQLVEADQGTNIARSPPPERARAILSRGWPGLFAWLVDSERGIGDRWEVALDIFGR